MTIEQQIEEIEVSIDEAKKAVELRDSILKLTKNKDFKKVIEENYFEKHASRLVLLKADPNMQKEEEQKNIMDNINAIGHFRQYLRTVIQLGNQAERDIISNEQAREEILAEA